MRHPSATVCANVFCAMTIRTDHTDLDLLLGWRRGDARMGAELYDRHKTAVTNLFRRNVQSKQDVPDLVQQTFLACVHGKNDPAITGNVRGYILGIAFHTMTAFFRRARTAPTLGIENGQGTTLASIEPDPEYLLTLGDEQRLLMKAIRRLPIEYQVIIDLNNWEGITCDEIAAILGSPRALCAAAFNAVVRRSKRTSLRWRTRPICWLPRRCPSAVGSAGYTHGSQLRRARPTPPTDRLRAS